MTNNSYYLTAFLLSIFALSAMASLKGGTLTIHMNTTKYQDGQVGDFVHEDILFDFVARHINHGDFTWDNVWSFTELESGEFKLFDKNGDEVIVTLHEGEHPTQDLGTILATVDHNHEGRVETIASLIGNTVDLAFARKREARKQRAVAAQTAGKVASGVAEQVAQEVAQDVAQDVASQLLKSNKLPKAAVAKATGQITSQIAAGVAQKVAKVVANDVAHELIDGNANFGTSSAESINVNLNAHRLEEATEDNIAATQTAGKVASGVAEQVAQEVAKDVAQDVASQLLKSNKLPKAAVAKATGQIASQVAAGVAKEVAKTVAKDVTHELIDGNARFGTSPSESIKVKVNAPGLEGLTSGISV